MLRGFHRRFCLRSVHYRGTPEVPGLVLGLDRGGSCRGVAFQVAPAAAREVLDYLEARENILGEIVYRRRLLKLGLASGRDVQGIAYVAERAHPAYCQLSETETAQTIARAQGEAGTNRDYLINTARQLAALGLRDAGLERLVTLVLASAG
ncbi:MAG: ChaC-like protein [Rubritepida sp.]|nr:ChaC-like protein [Rubritepida sp.]